jgi:hypothetical protein
MKTNLRIIALTIFLFVSASYSQWTYCPGSVEMTGLGSFPYISIVDQNTAWVAGGIGGAPKVYRTTNGGLNFINSTGNLTGPEFYAIWAIDATSCLVGDGGSSGGTGGNAKIWRTSNGGANWTTVLTTGGTAGFFNGISGVLLNRNIAYAQSDAPSGSSIFWAKTTDGGISWQTGSTSTGGSVGIAGSVWCSSAQIFGYGINGFARVVYSTDGGSNFNAGNLSVSGTATSGFSAFHTGAFMLAATTTSLPNISRSTNGGVSWLNVNVGGTISGTCVIKYVQGTSTVYLLGLAGTNPMRKSVDNGTTWTTMTTAGITGLNDMSFMLSTPIVYGYAISNNGSVIKLAENITLGINTINNSIPENYSLEQNYPNPFNPLTKIDFSVPVNGHVSMKVYNSIGERISELVNSELTAGNYSVDFKGENLPSGIYFYVLNAGKFSQTNKMILVK